MQEYLFVCCLYVCVQYDHIRRQSVIAVGRHNPCLNKRTRVFTGGIHSVAFCILHMESDIVAYRMKN